MEDELGKMAYSIEARLVMFKRETAVSEGIKSR
jgi:hypothetical protein